MKHLFVTTVLILITLSGFGQITTASITGTVGSNDGDLIGATIVATHVPSGTVYGVVTLENGNYYIPNMRVGGPYNLEVSYLGYAGQTKEDIYLQLGQKTRLDFILESEGVGLDEVVISGELDPTLNSERTGAETQINSEQFITMPTISRSAEDFTRLNPMSAEGGSFAGRNDQFNNYSLDGAIFNNPFGLDAATPGGQTDAQPVSIDAIEQISVAIAPYDVTQSGFTGANINAVTKSGTNSLEGSAFVFGRNSAMIGGKVGDTEVSTGDLSSLNAGFAIGGPIVKNKVFFFANLELQQRSDLGSYFIPSDGNQDDGNESRVLETDMMMVSNLLKELYDYDTGAISGFTHKANNTKGLIKLDFNLNSGNKLTATYNFLDAFKDKPAHPSAIGPRGPSLTTLQFENTGYRINNVLHQYKVELNSVISSKFANKFQAGYTQFRDSRDPFSSPFPVLNIGKDGSRYIIAGHEPFSINNVLDQDVFQFRNDFSIYSGNHSLLIGAAFERFNFNNSFNLTGYGARVFFPDIDINDFADVVSSPEFAAEVESARQAFESNNENDSWALAETNLGQFSAYIQDEFKASDNLSLTLGVRLDMPLYFNTADLIQENIERKGGDINDGGTYAPDVTYYDKDGNPVTFNHSDLPTGNLLINPRLGFNYSLDSERTSQLRGGTGLFSGRFPFVWIGNQVANPDFFFYNMTDPDFKFPQIWRTNIGYDTKLSNGLKLTADVIYTKDLQAQMVRNYGLISPSGSLSGPGSRPIYLDSDRAQGPFGGATNAYVFTNANTGSSTNISIQAQKSWEKLYLMIGYNFLMSTDAASIDAEISSDAYDRNPANVQNTNIEEVAPSLYGNRHRILGTVSKVFSYGNWNTSISLFGELVEGNRYSYTYAGDINNDGSSLNDLIYIPTEEEIGQMNFTGNGASAFNEYITQDNYLSSRRGEFAEKYGSLSPWYSDLDLRILQTLNLSNGDKISLSLDILNLGNLVNSNWGVRDIATNTGLAQPIAVSVTNGDPSYTFIGTGEGTNTFFNDFSTLSRWQAQLGLRYNF